MRHIEIKERRMLFNRTMSADIPETYREMSARQFHLICRLNRKEIPDEEFIIDFCNLNSRLWNHLDLFYVYKLAEMVQDISSDKYVDFFYDDKVRIGSVKYCLPLVSSISLMQFMAVDTFASWYQVTKKDSFLINFFSVLALPSGHQFFDYDPTSTVRTLSALTKSNPDYLTLMNDTLINWQLIKAWLSDKYPHMFPVAETEAPDEGKTPAPADWSQFFDSLIGERLENIEAYKRLPAVDVFRITNGRIRDRLFKK